MIKIRAYTKYELLGASSRYRTIQFISRLEKNNIVLDQSYLFSDKYLNQKHSSKPYLMTAIYCYLRRLTIFVADLFRYKNFFIEKEIFPYLPPFTEIILKLLRKRYILDYDDAVWLNQMDRISYLKPINRWKYLWIAKNSIHITVGSTALFNFMKELNKKTTLIPTVIDKDKYKPRSKFDNKEFVIGWIGSNSTSHHLLEVNNVLHTLQARYPNIIIRLVGFDCRLKNLLKFKAEVVKWESRKEIDLIQSFDVGIMPLKRGDYEKFKCSFKIIQYFGNGIPAVATKIGNNLSVIKQGYNGFLCSEPDHWISSLEFYILNPKKRLLHGNAAYNLIEGKFNTEVQTERLTKIFCSNFKT